MRPIDHEGTNMVARTPEGLSQRDVAPVRATLTECVLPSGLKAPCVEVLWQLDQDDVAKLMEAFRRGDQAGVMVSFLGTQILAHELRVCAIGLEPGRVR